MAPELGEDDGPPVRRTAGSTAVIIPGRGAAAAGGLRTSTIRYEVAIVGAKEHRVEVRVAIPTQGAGTVDLVLPSWIPGSYEIRDYAQFVRSLRGFAGSPAEPIPVERVGKARWRLTTAGHESVTAELVVYGHATADDALDVAEDHLFINGVRCFPYVDGRKLEPVEVSLHVPPDWEIVTELAPAGHQPPTFRARDYDELVDQPIEAGHPQTTSFVARGIPHRIVVFGNAGNLEPHRLEADLKRTTEATIDYFGGSPVERYTFFVHPSDQPGGALEHRASNVAAIQRSRFRPAKEYRFHLWVFTHEYFHLYNVKRIRPAVLGPFDYERESPTRLLWWMEGTTDYVSWLLVRRSGAVTPKQYLDLVAEQAKMVLQMPGRTNRSLEEASFLSWIDLYQIHEESLNQTISYYRQGHIVSLALDLEIRRLSENRASLDTVFRRLWEEYGKVGRGLKEDELEPVIAQATGVDVRPFFDRYVRGTADLDLNAFVKAGGLSFGPKEKPKDDPDLEDVGYLGAETSLRDGAIRVTNVRDGSPARRGGLDPGDEIIALNGEKVTPTTFEAAMKTRPPGHELTFSVFRRGLLTSVTVQLGSPVPETYEFTPRADATESEKALYASWIGAAWEPPKPAAGSPPKPA